MKGIGLLIVDDHGIARSGIRAYLESRGSFEILGEAETGAQAVAKAGELNPDVILMDLMLPDFDGIEAARRIRERAADAAIVMITSMDNDDSILRALETGILSWLPKSVSPSELVMAITAASGGDSYLPQEISRKVAALISRRARGRSPIDAVSEREREVLDLVAHGRTNAEISVDLGISEKTVKCHVSSILMKLGVEDRTKAAALAWESGFMKRSAGK
jgi:DNA-binding NarL/FixJ family response regulator